MDKALSPNLQEGQQIAGIAQVLAILALVVMAINIAVELGSRVAAAVGNETPWRDDLRAIGLVLVSLLPAFLLFEAVNQLRRALKLYCNGEFFSAAAASKVALAGDYAIGAMVAVILVVPNLLLWVSSRGGFDWRFESEFIGMFAFALFVSAVGRILAAAAELKAENESFV